VDDKLKWGYARRRFCRGCSRTAVQFRSPPLLIPTPSPRSKDRSMSDEKRVRIVSTKSGGNTDPEITLCGVPIDMIQSAVLGCSWFGVTDGKPEFIPHDEGKYHELWFLSGDFKMRGPLRDFYNNLDDGLSNDAKWTKVVNWLCRNTDFGTLDICCQRAAMVIDG